MKKFMTYASAAIVLLTTPFAIAQQEADMNTEGKIEATMQNSQQSEQTSERPALRPYKELVLIVLDNQRKEIAELKAKAKTEDYKAGLDKLDEILVNTRNYAASLDNVADRLELNKIGRFLSGEVDQLLSNIKYSIENEGR